MNNTTLLERCLTPISIELRHAIWFLENETLDESQKKLAQYEVDNLKALKADLQVSIAEQANCESTQPDNPCHEDDGCPTEGAVLKRCWRETQALIKTEQAKPQEPDFYLSPQQLAQLKLCDTLLCELSTVKMEGATACYTRPQALEPMSEDEIINIRKAVGDDISKPYGSSIAFATAILAKYNIGVKK